MFARTWRGLVHWGLFCVLCLTCVWPDILIVFVAPVHWGLLDAHGLRWRLVPCFAAWLHSMFARSWLLGYTSSSPVSTLWRRFFSGTVGFDQDRGKLDPFTGNGQWQWHLLAPVSVAKKIRLMLAFSHLSCAIARRMWSFVQDLCKIFVSLPAY